MPLRIGIISIGEMGLGVAKLLMSRHFPVATCLADRTSATRCRAESAGIKIHEDYESFVDVSDVVLSIVPPKDALNTASTIAKNFTKTKQREKKLYYFDLNAVSSASAIRIGKTLPISEDSNANRIIYYDGGIIGPPPKQADSAWSKPSIVISGPQSPSATSSSLGQLAELLNMNYLSDQIGQASGLKMCFASLTKGFTSIAIQSYTTAHRLGVLPELQKHLKEFSPASHGLAERGLVGMPPKAYRWVNEMEEISKTFNETGFGGNMFDAVAETYRTISEDTILGEEKTENRKRGLKPEDVADCINQGLIKRRK